MAISSQQVTVGTSATQLSIAPADQSVGSCCAVQNTGSVTISLGGPGVTTATGYPLAAGASISIDLGTVGMTGNPLGGVPPVTVDELLFGIVASGTSTAAVLMTGV